MSEENIIRTTSTSVSQRFTSAGPQTKIARRSFRRSLRRQRKNIIRYGLLAANAAILVGALLLISNNQSSSEIARQNLVSASSSKAAANPLDQLSSADIAVNVANLTALPESNSVRNHADSFNDSLTSQQVVLGEVVATKPQIVSGGQAKSRKDIIKYTTVAGDTVSALAQRFGVTSDSIRWSNGLTSDRLNAGRQLTIPPVNGIIYTVKAGDTPASLAQKYNTNKDLLVTFNDAELTGFRPGEQIVIPNGTPPATASSFAWGGSFTATYSSNGYDYGWCTWWAAKRRQEIGKPIPSNLGNAITWARLAQRAGYAVDSNPRAGDVAYYKTIGGMGHVGFVEQVNDDGSIWISDMNYFGVSEIGGSTPAGGWGRRSFHQVSPGQFGNFLFIH